MTEKQTPSNPSNGFVGFELVVALMVFIILGLVAYFIYHSLHPKPIASPTTAQSAASPTPTSSYAVLSPATVPPKTAECTQPISFAANGTSGPVQCANGDLNATEWSALAALEPTVMSLGYNATATQVQSALCSDANASSSDANTKNGSLVEAVVYQISVLYYGWNFSSNPASVLSGGC
jgi:hypothetical protein